MFPINLFRFEACQLIPASLDTVWNFFSHPANLRTITPPALDFRILSPVPSEIYPGLIIVYAVRPLWRIPVKWVSEITHLEARRFFVDEQRFGPYRFWHHRHSFEPTSEGVLMRDVVHYALPVPPFDTLLDAWIVRPKIEAIFAYRRQRIAELFGAGPPPERRRGAPGD